VALSWLPYLFVAAVLSMLVLNLMRFGALFRKLDGLAEELARLSGRVVAVERQINDYWRGIEDRVGKIQETFETGRACRVGATIAEVDSKMGHINRKMTELLENLPRSSRNSEDA
jgi:fructoselysine-6-P-deglycase FrlB-like protein